MMNGKDKGNSAFSIHNSELIVPEIRFKGFSGEWDKLTLGELGSVAMNKRIFKNQTATTGDVPFFKIGTFGNKPDAFISKALFEEYKAKYPYPVAGDLLLSASGSIGRVVEYKGEEQYFQDSNIVWLKHDGKIDNLFLKVFYSIVKWSGLEGSTIKRLYNKNILDTEIGVPERQEQTQIGNYFQKLDSLINQHQKKHDKLSNIKKAMLELMFPKKGENIPEIRFKEFSGGWEEIKFSEIFNEKYGIRRGPFGGSIKKEMFVSKSDYVVYEQRNAIYDRYDTRYNISKEKYQELINFSLTSGDFIMSGAGTIGRVSRVPDGVKHGVFNQAIIRMKINDERVDSEFFLQWIRSKKMQERLTESNPASAMVNLVPMSELKAWDVVVPNKDEQTAIGNYFQKLDALINQHQQQITKLNNIKQACLSKMFV
jgi:type I restriction enzyme S subunit